MDPTVPAAATASPYTSLVNPGMHNMPVVNYNNLMNVKDSRWLQLEVCREFQRNKCTRPDTECKFAHPPSTVEVQTGRVTACYDSIKGRCNREKPPCKYFHPPQHLKDQLLINGRNHLALKNAFMTQIHNIPATQHTQLVHPVVPPDVDSLNQQYASKQYPMYQTNAAYMTGVAAMPNYNPYIASQPVMTVGVSDAVAQSLNNVCPQQMMTQQKIARTDRLEVCREFQRGACKRCESECRFAHPPDHVSTTDDGTVTVCMDAVKGRCVREPCRYFHPPPHLEAQLRAVQVRPAQQSVPGAAVAAVAPTVPLTAPTELGKKRGRDPGDELFMAFSGMCMPYKRPAPEKSGVTLYQPGSAAYHQALMQQIGGQTYVPVSCEYGGSGSLALSQSTIEGPSSSPANPSASTASEVPPSSLAHTTTYSSSTSVSPPVKTAPSTSSPNAKISGLAASSSTSNPGTSPSLPVNVFSYTGVPINKSVRPAVKPPNLLPTAGTALPPTFPSAAAAAAAAASPNLAGLGNVGYGMPLPAYGLPYPSNLSSILSTGASMGGLAPQAIPMALPGVANANMGLPMHSYPLMYSQYPASSFVLPQLSALSSNPQASWAQQATEQPYKKLKTS